MNKPKPWYKKKKVWTAILTTLILIGNEWLGLDLDTYKILSIASLGTALILGESYIDANK